MFISPAELAARYSVVESTIWRWCKSRPGFPQPIKLSHRCSRFRLADVEAFDASL